MDRTHVQFATYGTHNITKYVNQVKTIHYKNETKDNSLLQIGHLLSSQE
jgi:hypothetical protein